jgi:AbrB family looped-hinge helix DNA binding protein
MSSKGQVVIPEEIRDRLGLQSGTQFVVVGDRDVVILKAISAPSMKQFDNLIAKARQQARRSGLKKSDIDAAVAKDQSRRSH